MAESLEMNGAQTWNRTRDTGIFSPLLYRLSYLGNGMTCFNNGVYFVVFAAFCQEKIKNILAEKIGAAWGFAAEILKREHSYG